KLDHFEAALDVALGVGDHLAVFAGEKLGERLHVGFDEALELEHHAGAALRVRAGPGGERFCGGLNGEIDVAGRGEADLGLDVAGVGVEDVGLAARGHFGGFAADEAVYAPHEKLRFTRWEYPRLCWLTNRS